MLKDLFIAHSSSSAQRALEGNFAISLNLEPFERSEVTAKQVPIELANTNTVKLTIKNQGGECSIALLANDQRVYANAAFVFNEVDYCEAQWYVWMANLVRSIDWLPERTKDELHDILQWRKYAALSLY